MNAVILACSSLVRHVNAAQAKMETNYPLIIVDRKYHVEPKEMKQQIFERLQKLPERVDTVLAAMGFCGGSWNKAPSEKRIVIPRADDCISLLLHADDARHPNLKEEGHFYLRDSDTTSYSLIAMKQNLCTKYGIRKGQSIFDSWFASYTDVDIIDTGEYDCYSEEYIAEAKKNADIIHCRLNHVNGSNMLLEKLVSGRWDQQFIVVEPGQMLSHEDFVS